jgi:hypothetical protein
MTLLTFIVLCLFSFLSFGQTSSFVGSYKHTTWHGGGFAGGPDGSCYVTPPTYSVTDEIIIEASGRVVKLSDTTFYSGTIHSIFDFSCDTLFIGHVTITNDTLVATYTEKPLCNSDTIYLMKQARKLAYFAQPFTETYYWINESDNLGLMFENEIYTKKQ